MSVFVRLNPSILTADLIGFSEDPKKVEWARYSLSGLTFGYYDGYLKLSAIGENDFFPTEIAPYVLEITSKFSLFNYREPGKYIVKGLGVVEVVNKRDHKDNFSLEVLITAKSMHNLKKLREMILSGSITPTISYEAEQKTSIQLDKEVATITLLTSEVNKQKVVVQKLVAFAKHLIGSKWFGKASLFDQLDELSKG